MLYVVVAIEFGVLGYKLYPALEEFFDFSYLNPEDESIPTRAQVRALKQNIRDLRDECHTLRKANINLTAAIEVACDDSHKSQDEIMHQLREDLIEASKRAMDKRING